MGIDKLYTALEAAELLGVSEKSIRRYILSRRINFVKILGGAVRIKQSEIDRVIEEGTVKVGDYDFDPKKKRPTPVKAAGAKKTA